MIQIKNRFTGAVIFEGEYGSVRDALVAAVKARANLADADLADAYLARANLARANLADADLAGANLARANLADADLADAIYDVLPATPEESVVALDKVREIILDNERRLNMGLWHEDDKWAQRTCAEEATCGTAHCLAGWLQVCSTNEKIRKLPNVEMAGALAAPVARKMFFESNGRALRWLKDREYADSSATK